MSNYQSPESHAACQELCRDGDLEEHVMESSRHVQLAELSCRAGDLAISGDLSFKHGDSISLSSVCHVDIHQFFMMVI